MGADLKPDRGRRNLETRARATRAQHAEVVLSVPGTLLDLPADKIILLLFFDPYTGLKRIDRPAASAAEASSGPRIVKIVGRRL